MKRPGKSARHLGRRFISDERGNIAFIAAACMLLVTGCAALGIDIGSVFTDKRRAQGAADLAAIVAASDITRAPRAAAATVARNNFPPDSLVAVETGVYKADTSIVPQQRFTAGAAPANAVRVTMQTRTPLFFGKVLTGDPTVNLRVTSVATTTQLATFAIGSRLASLNGGLLNQLLGQMLGTSLSLSAMDYQALADAKVNLFDFMSALATRANLTGVSYDSLLQSNLKVTDIIAALQSSGVTGTASSALSNVGSSLSGITTKVTLGDLIDAGPYADMTVGQQPKVGVDLAALDLLSATAQLANGTHQIAVNLNLGLPGIAAVSLQVTVGERPVGSSWITIGQAGASVHTAQTRILATVQLLGGGSVAAVNLPVYVEVAAGTATLNSVSCGYPDISSSTAQLGVSPGIVDAWIGGVSNADMNNFTSKPNPPAATLVDLGAIKVTGRAHATMANTSPTNVNFSYADIQAQTRKTVNTTSFTSSLTGSLLGDLTLAIQVGPLALPIPGLGPQVTSIISGATGSIDTLLNTVLQTLGVGLGQADVWVAGIRCDGAVLVN
ncbi:pilus assembly protein TadG-related protein [[Pseudomonas] carboxydohydrogena]|uniref:Pilus assembly protein TadG-related protein n=1 Tax=Afipia carboxydohydrogena TaxID=290 RepID=A0ABY8BMH8_AFICR|nr:TadG family pilus assembly protein [[Pseudomonas] carboxydohydrogena]WEF51190.1 pilus assembly protein TadG-related protein [[Pseudomonas] carboxydohydrogena]